MVQSSTRDLLNVREVQNGLETPYQVLTFYELSGKLRKAFDASICALIFKVTKLFYSALSLLSQSDSKVWVSFRC